VGVRPVQAARTVRYHIRGDAQETAHLPPLVPSHDRAAVLVVLVLRVHVVRPVVRCYELLRAFDDVLVLRGQRHGLPDAQASVHVHHGQSADANAGRLFHKLHHVRLPKGRWPAILPGVPDQCHDVVPDVL